MLTLFCYVRDNDHMQVFKVEIECVSDLRDAIREEKRLIFDDIPSNSLSLWKASVPNNRNLKKEFEALSLVDGDRLPPFEILSDIFLSGLETKFVHIIIDRWRSGGL